VVSPDSWQLGRDSRSLTPPRPPQWDEEEKWTQGKAREWKYRQFSKTMIENTSTTNNDKSAKQTIHNTIFFSLPDDPLPSQCPSSDRRMWNSWILQILWNSQKKSKLMEKFELPKREDPCPLANPIYKLRMTSVVWNISIGQPGLPVWLCSLPSPAHLLIS